MTSIPEHSPEVGIHAGHQLRFVDLGHDEIWLQNWLSADASRLGLGNVRVLAQELTQGKGGSLDILAADGDRYYSIEVQLGEIDASHGFRVLDYWARNRLRYPNKTHVAVLICESSGGRYRQALEALVEFLPLIVIELGVWRGQNEAILVPSIELHPNDLDVAGLPGGIEGERTAEDWRSAITDDAWMFHEEFARWTTEHLGDVRVDYSPNSYVGIRRGRRVWAPLWFRKEGAYTYLPDPDGSREAEPSAAFHRFVELLAPDEIDISWTSKYNAGANPIAVGLHRSDLTKEHLHEFLKATFDILEPNATPWSERNPLNESAEEAPESPDASGNRVSGRAPDGEPFSRGV